MNILSTKQAAERLHICDSMVRRLMRQNKLTGLKISNNCWIIYDDEIFRRAEMKYNAKRGK
jgi:predicted site-specific integrase-resolvase